MKGRRAALALAVLAATFAAQASCAAVFGVDEEGLHNVIADMCQCAALQDLPTLSDCEETLSARFDNVGAATSKDWLAHYQTARCDLCDNVLACLSEEPTCTLGKCTRAEECCQLRGAGAPKCVGGSCE